MKVKSLADVDFPDLAQKIVNLIGGKAYLGSDNNSFLLERKNEKGDKYFKLELKKVKEKGKSEFIFFLELEEGFIEPKKVMSSFKSKELSNLYVTISEQGELENKKVTFLTVTDERYIIFEIEESFKTVVISSPGKGKKVEKEEPEEVKQKLIEI